MIDVADLRRSLCDSIGLAAMNGEGDGIRVELPLYYGDGDQISLVIHEQPGGGFRLSDGGETLTRVSTYSSAQSLGHKFKRFCEFHGIEHTGGELSAIVRSADEIGTMAFEVSQAMISLVDFASGGVAKPTPQARERRALQLLAKKRLEEAGVWDDRDFHQTTKLEVLWSGTDRKIPLVFDYCYGVQKFPGTVLSRAVLTDSQSVTSLALKFEKMKQSRYRQKVVRIALVAADGGDEAESPSLRRMSSADSEAILGTVSEIVDLRENESPDRIRSLLRAA